MTSRWSALAVVAAALAGSLASPPQLVFALVALPVVALCVGSRWALGPVSGNALSFVAGFAGLMVTRSLSAIDIEHDASLLSEREVLFLLPLVQVAAFRCLLANPQGGARLTAAVVVLALTAGGGARSGAFFVPLAALACFACLRAMSTSDAGQHRRPPLKGKRLVAVGVATAATAISVGAAALIGPALHALVLDRMQHAYGKSRMGFSDRLELGDMTHLLSDSRVMLRVRGSSAPELLRGAVFSSYTTGTWRRADDTPVQHTPGLSFRPPEGSGWWELEHAHRPQRYFLPANATQVRASSGGYSRDGYGIVSPPKKQFAKRVWFRRDGGASRQPPRNLEVRMPRRTHRALLKIARDWGADQGSARQRLQLIEQRLRKDYRYSLVSNHGTKHDPVVDFLLLHREGHCEFFASALALLGRSVGVPTRLVSGYRVAESSRFGYWVVRRRHAHTWVDAWVDGAWLSLDPTPVAEPSTSAETPLLSALVDGLRTTWEKVDDWLEERTTFELLVALTLLAGLLLITRSLKRRRDLKRPPKFIAQSLEGFVALNRSLAGRGLGRERSETLARQADRVETSHELLEAERREVAGVLRTYALLLYAGRGQAQDINQKLLERARDIGRTPKVP